MAKKMYYSEEEAAEMLGITPEQLDNYVRDDKLRIFQDGAKRMFKGDEVEALAGGGQEEEIELSPADSAADQVSLSEADSAAGAEPPGKEDTVITAEGISIFDDEDLEIEAADPMAKTQIAPSLEERMSMEGVGSGSGLLDLTRESDDTSLGAEVLDHIEMEEGIEAGLSGTGAGEAGYGAQPTPPPVPVVVAAPVEAIDAASGLFGGIAVGCALVFVVLGAVVLAAARSAMPDYLVFMKKQVPLVVGAAVVVVLVLAIIGLMVGKAAATRQRVMGRMGG